MTSSIPWKPTHAGRELVLGDTDLDLTLSRPEVKLTTYERSTAAVERYWQLRNSSGGAPVHHHGDVPGGEREVAARCRQACNNDSIRLEVVEGRWAPSAPGTPRDLPEKEVARVLGVPGVTKCQAHAARATAAALHSAEAAAGAGQAAAAQEPRRSPHADLAAALARAMDQVARAAPLEQAPNDREAALQLCHPQQGPGGVASEGTVVQHATASTVSSGFNRKRYAPYCAWGGVHNECQL